MISPSAIGIAADREWIVSEDLTVRARGTVDLPVLATPQLIFMLEDTCVHAVRASLDPHELTVGTAVHVDHLAAATVGARVRVHSELVAIRGRRLVFRIEASAGDRVIGRGLHERAIVDKRRFAEKIAG